MTKENANNLKPRPPIVVVMGHVDHGKTSLLDYIRKANVAGREAGGITQAVGAYEITHNLRKVTFIDTPGHEAFSKMRSRGAEVADFAVLVVAADEGVKPQTKEAIDILKSTKTPFVVAINKIDRTGGDIERAKNDLTAAEVYLEGFGGQVSYHGISAKTGEGVNELIDLIILAADLENLTYDPGAPASGYVLEIQHNRRRGIEASVIIKNGTLRRGDAIYTRVASGKAKVLENFLGEAVDRLEPSAPAIIVGFDKLPGVGEEFSTAGVPMAGKEPASPKATPRRELQRGEQIANGGRQNEPVARKKGGWGLSLILKASDVGSLEALATVVQALEREDKQIHIFEKSVGDITDGDVKSAIASKSVIIGFKNRVDRGAKNLAGAQVVQIITSGVIYDLVKAVGEFLAEAGKPKTVGELEVLAVFNQKKLEKQLIGGKIVSGVFRSKAHFEIIRGLAAASDSSGGANEEKVGTGKVMSLRDKKNDIAEAKEGSEVGVFANSQVAIRVGDTLVITK